MQRTLESSFFVCLFVFRFLGDTGGHSELKEQLTYSFKNHLLVWGTDFLNQRDGRDELCARLPLPSLSLSPLSACALFDGRARDFRTVQLDTGRFSLILFFSFIHVYRSLSPTGSSPSLRSSSRPHKEYYERVRERGPASPSCHTCKGGQLHLKSVLTKM